jgi:hypothetical protein
MNMPRISLVLTLINLALLVFLLVRVKDATVSGSPVIRTRGLELINDAGQIRANLHLKSEDTVELDLFDQTGAVRVKLGGGKGGSGLFLADETTNTGVQIIARRNGTPDQPATTGIIFTGADGLMKVVGP